VAKQKLLEEVRRSPAAHLVDLVAPRIKPSIRLRTNPVRLDAVDLGGTRIGGVPDLPAAIGWPQRGDQPLGFIAQVRLSDVRELDPDTLLPPAGWLCFFYDVANRPAGYDPAHGDGWKVLYFDAPADSLRRLSAPPSLEDVAFTPCAVTPEAEDTLPCSSALITEGALEPMSDDFNAYFDFIEEYHRDQAGPLHRLLGNPDAIQGEMRFACQFASNGLNFGHPSVLEDPRAEALAAGVEDWVLLLQLDSDEDGPGWMWGDCGRLFWWIRRQNLANRDFSHAWVVSQCY
jgi:uncharacterized protein YwqG